MPRSRNQTPVMPGQAVITEAAAAPVVLHREVEEVATATEAVVKASEAARVAVREVVRGAADELVAVRTSLWTPTLVKRTAAAAWSIRTMIC
jgi:hypothetical protein